MSFGVSKDNFDYIQYSIQNNNLFLFTTLGRYMAVWLVAPNQHTSYSHFILTKNGLPLYFAMS